MKEPKRRRSLDGVVLIMILTVMAVLIVILMTTLTVVTTANQRIYTKYEENQAYYSARSALDIFTQNLLVDELRIADNNALNPTSVSKKTYEFGTGGASNTADMTQGLALQLDLYTIEAQSGQNVKQSDLNVPTITGTNKQYAKYYGTDSSKVFTDNSDPSNPKQYILYNVTLPVTSGTDVSGKMADIDSTTQMSVATIKVEVLSRTYNLGTVGGVAVDPTTFWAGATDAQKAEAVATGDRKKDQVSIKITSTVTFNGATSTAVLICDNKAKTPVVKPGANAITTFGGSNSDNVSIIGGASMRDDVDWGNKGFEYGSIYAEKDFVMGNSTGPEFHFYGGESMFIGGDFKIIGGQVKVNGHNPAGASDDTKPFVYVAGKTYASQLNDVFKDVDLITNGFEFTSNDFVHAGNIYCDGDFDVDATNVNITGDIYVKGDIYLRSSNPGGFKYDEPNNALYLGGINGTINLNGKIYAMRWDNGLGANVPYVIYDSATGGASIASGTLVPWTGTLDLSTVNTQIKDSEGEDAAISFTLPDGTTKQLQTHGSNFNKYYQKDAAGDLITPPTPISAGVKSPHGADVALTPANLGISADYTSFLSASLSTNNFYGNTVTAEIDTTSGDVRCIFNPPNSGNMGLHIMGGGKVEMVIPSDSNWHGGECKILVDNDTELVIYGDGDIRIQKFWVYDEMTAKAISAGDSVYAGNVGAHIRSPQISYFISGNGVFEVQNDGFLTGYYYGPSTQLNLYAAGGSNIDFYYNDNAIGSKKVAIVGSVVCDELTLRNEIGVAYINPNIGDDDDDSDPGAPLYDFEAAYYARV